MDTYSILRELADSWILIGLFGFFVGAVLWAFRPGGTRGYHDTADIPFRNEDKPAVTAPYESEEAL